MHQITLLTVGSLKKSFFTEACHEYTKRLQKQCAFKMEEIPASKQSDPTKQKEEECERILKRLESTTGQVWALDERGKQMDSQEMSQKIEKLKDAGQPMIIILGGAYGLTDAIRQQADCVLTLSKMTFPHELCRLLFLEQLYRAHEITRGTGYHH